MTRIVYSVKDCYLSAKGHAFTAPMGQDIVCAGVSVLTQALLNTLIAEEEEKNIKLEWTMGPGQIMMQAMPVNGRQGAKIRHYFTVVITGLKAIAENYAGHIEMEEVQEHGDV